MGRPEDPPDVDFVLSDDAPGADEDLAQPEIREWPRLRRARVPLAVAAGIGVAVAAVVTVAGGRSHPTPVAAPSSSPTVQPTPTGPVTAPPYLFRGRLPPATALTRPVAGRHPAVRFGLIPSGPDFSLSDVQAAEHCPKSISCDGSSQVPTALVAALRQQFPGIDRIQAHTVLAHRDAPGSALWSRHLTARVGAVQLAVLVRQPTRYAAPIALTSDGAGEPSSSVVVDAGGLIVGVEATAPRHTLPSFARLRRLAGERGLLVRS